MENIFISCVRDIGIKLYRLGRRYCVMYDVGDV
jgi:hypothetical protein